MIKKIITVKDATLEWIREFNSYPIHMIDTLIKADPFSWQEITPPTVNDTVYCSTHHSSGTITDITIDEDGEKSYEIQLDGGDSVTATIDEFYVKYDGSLPMWATMWSFGDNLDNEWLEKDDNLQVMANCGFRIYQHEEYGYFFGIDGAGYDFYEAHWIPLYKARGIHWHEEE